MTAVCPLQAAAVLRLALLVTHQKAILKHHLTGLCGVSLTKERTKKMVRQLATARLPASKSVRQSRVNFTRADRDDRGLTEDLFQNGEIFAGLYGRL